jgi:RNA polymerase sigma-32 factor
MAAAAGQRATIGYIKASMRTPLLTREREFLLAQRWRDAGDTDAMHELVCAYAKLVIALAARYRAYGLPLADLVQEGNLGLMQAVRRFEPEREVRFSTYATWWIRSAMQDYVLRNWSIVRNGTTAAQKSLFFKLRSLRASIEEVSGRPLGERGRQQIAAALKVETAEVEQMEMRLAGTDQSLNAPVGDGQDEWQDLLADRAPSPEEVVIGLRDGATRARWLAEALGELSPREQRIISERRLSEEGATLEELGRTLGISKERVRQLEHAALSKLRQSMTRRADRRADLLIEAS